LGKSLDTASDDEINAKKERFKAMCFMLRADKGCHSHLIDELKKEYLEGGTNIPLPSHKPTSCLQGRQGKLDAFT